MAIEKLERYEGYDTFSDIAICVNGDYVLYSAARAREDALLEALRGILEVLPKGRCGSPTCGGQCAVRKRADAAIAEIERTR